MALIWKMNHFKCEEPILAYTSQGEVLIFLKNIFKTFRLIK